MDDYDLEDGARQLAALQNAIRFAVARFERVTWGYDGDCGTADIIAKLEESLPENSAVRPS